MEDLEKLFISATASLRRALEIIDKGSVRIALVVDEERRLLGTLTDGDIRRAILRKGKVFESSIEGIFNDRPVTCKTTDSKEEILGIAARNKVFQIPLVDEENKIIDIMQVDELLNNPPKTNKVVLMVGGKGERLQPLTAKTPKPLLHVGSRPILETIIKNFASAGYVNFELCVNYLSEKIEDYFEDGKRLGVNINYISEEKKLGTAGALGYLKERLTEPFFVMNGDLLTNINFEFLHQYHLSQKSDATMAVREYDFEVPYGVVSVENSRIVGLEEKPIQRFFVNAGIYMLSPEILEYVKSGQHLDMTTLFETLMEKEKNTFSFPLREYWLDIGHLRDYERANLEFNQVFD